MPPRSVVVTGANRGIGFGLVQQFLKNPEVQHVIATARDVEKAEALNSIRDPRLHVLQLALTCDQSIDDFVEKVAEIVGENGLNLLVNNAGIMLPYLPHTPPNRATIFELFDVNTISVVILSQKLLPLLEKAAKFNTEEKKMSISRAAVINIASELLGSIELNTGGSAVFDSLAYRMTKTALNQFTKTFAIDLKKDGILVAGLCPGWVKTDMGTKDGKLTIEESTSELVASFEKLDENHTGGYFRRDLSVIPY